SCLYNACVITSVVSALPISLYIRNVTASTGFHALSLHDALPISHCCGIPRVDNRRPESLSHLRAKNGLTWRQDSRDGVDTRRVTREGSVPSSVHRSDHATRRGLLTLALPLSSSASKDRKSVV